MTLKPYSGSKGQMHRASGHRSCCGQRKWSPEELAGPSLSGSARPPCAVGESSRHPVALDLVKTFLWPWALSLSSRSLHCF